MHGAKNQPSQNIAVRQRLDEVARRYYAPLLSFFRKRTHDSLEVQDLVQQVFLKLSQHPQIGQMQNPDAYIFQTASNALKDRHRRETVRSGWLTQSLFETSEDEEIHSDFSPERILLGKEALSLLMTALRELPERTRDVFMLRCFEELKISEIAKLHNTSVRTVEKHSARALAHLIKVLK